MDHKSSSNIDADKELEDRGEQAPQSGNHDVIIAEIGEGARNVVVGKSIRIGHINIPRWLLYTIGAGCIALLAFMGLQTPEIVRLARAEAPIVKCLYPLEMDDTKFNIVMTPFTVVGENGKLTQSRDGAELARILYRYLTPALEQFSDVDAEIRSPHQACALSGATEAEQLASAENLAANVNANVVVYGSIKANGSNSQFEPRFYVRYEGFEEAPEIAGPHQLGAPILATVPVKAEDYQGLQQHQLGIRIRVLSLIIRGLAVYSRDDYAGAISYFEQAEQAPGWLDRNGKELVYLLLGNSYARLASAELRSEHLLPASEYYDRALAIHPNFVRAVIGKASVRYLQAIGDLAIPRADLVKLEVLNEAEELYRKALLMPTAESSSDIVAKSRIGLAQVDIARFFRLGDGSSLEQAKSELEKVVASYQAGELRIGALAGHAHGLLGVIAQQQGDKSAELDHYQNAIGLVSPHVQVLYLLMVANIFASQGDMDAAFEANGMAMLRAETLGDESLIQKVEANLRSLGGPQ